MSALGMRDPAVYQLAEAASVAVDFPKSGLPCSFRDLPERLTKLRPDFLDPEADSSRIGQDYHTSEKTLGRLYRNITLDREESSSANRLTQRASTEISSLERITQVL
jgi:hypothetical protein